MSNRSGSAGKRPKESQLQSSDRSAEQNIMTSNAQSQTGDEKPRKSSVSRTIEKAKAKFSSSSGSERLADDEGDFQEQKAQAIQKEKKKEEYKRLGLDDRVKFGMSGAGGFNS